MKLLIVDDQVTVVEGLQEEVNWEEIGIDEVFGAYSAAQAQQILKMQSIDIMLCDIEMPCEDGLSLVSWMRSQGMKTCVILLTAHAKFAYAQESVRLGVNEYILQPAPYAKIVAAVKGAVQNVRQAQTERQLTQYGQEYIRRERTIVTAAVWSWLTGKQNKKEINALADQGKVPRREETVFLLLMQTLRWSKLTNWEPELFAYALQNIIDEIFRPFAQKTLVVSMHRGEHAVYLWGDGYKLTVAGVQRQMAFFQRVCQQYFQCEMAVYLGGPILAGQSRRVWDELSAMQADNVTRGEGVFLLDRDNPQKNYHFFLPQTHDWVERLQGDYPELVEKEAYGLLDELVTEGKMCAQVLRDFNQDFLQVLYLAMGSDDSFWNQTLDETKNYEIYRNAAYSVENMKQLIHLAVSHLSSRGKTPEKELQQRIDEYIDAHITEEIHRGDLARAVYLNPDYLNRVFKRIAGHSLKEYVILRKMEAARRLLRTTRLPVNIVAGRVGFAQVSHFSSTYKKQFGCTPMQERKEN